ncbi:ergothioneine biosynthesis protein EgtB, partial [Streptomyces sp. SID7982]|nr:ergothioneine biosynthesis protein EgtB [Streptomyces sp. SID7982]
MSDAFDPTQVSGPAAAGFPFASGVDPEVLRRRALDALLAARDRTTLLTDSVDDGELTAQHSPLMSPLVWDLAHIGNQEEQWLLRAVG